MTRHRRRRPRRVRRQSGFTLTEILVVIGIIGVLVAILLPVMSKVRESSKRANCANNLRQIGQGLSNYALANNGVYPRIITKKVNNDDFLDHVEPAANLPNPFENEANGFNAIYGAFFLLVRDNHVQAKSFICPSTVDEPDTFEGGSPQTRSNFTIPYIGSSSGPLATNCSYTYVTVYPGLAAKFKVFKVGMLKGDYPLASDKSTRRCQVFPDDDLSSNGNSRNHNRKGQNVLRADGRVDWQDTIKCGDNADSIFFRNSGNVCNPLPALDLDDAVIQEY
jgi:prepilin-type N-terminal cleavage/methylation domain-containing protein